MNLNALSLYHFRKFQEIHFDYFKKINLFSGKNGSGKTSLLEALGIFCTGRSFRASSNEVLIEHTESAFTLRARYINNDEIINIGIEYDRKRGLKLSKNNNRHFDHRDRFLQQPVRLFTPENIYLFGQGASARLNFLNWGCYYLFPEFKGTLKSFLRLLEHRRVLLKTVVRYEELKIWDEKLVELNDIITRIRQNYFEELQRYWKLKLNDYFSKYVIDFSFIAGWDRSLDYRQQLADSFEFDKRYRTTRFGSHRADLRAASANVPITQLLSRGEMKTLVLILGALQLELFTKTSQNASWLLIDEFDAELDDFNLKNILKVLDHAPSQIFLTSQRCDFDRSWTIFEL